MKAYILTLIVIVNFLTVKFSSTEKILSNIRPKILLTKATYPYQNDKTKKLKGNSYKNRLEFYQLLQNELANIRGNRKLKTTSNSVTQIQSTSVTKQEDESLWIKFLNTLNKYNDIRYRF